MPLLNWRKSSGIDDDGDDAREWEQTGNRGSVGESMRARALRAQWKTLVGGKANLSSMFHPWTEVAG
jgi:hypothetical protein